MNAAHSTFGLWKYNPVVCWRPGAPRRVTKTQSEIPRPKIQSEGLDWRRSRRRAGSEGGRRGTRGLGDAWATGDAAMAILVHFVWEYRIRPPFQDRRLFRSARKAIASQLLPLHHPLPPQILPLPSHPFGPSSQRQAKLEAKAIIRGHQEVYKPPEGRGPDAASHSLLFFELLKLHIHTVSTWWVRTRSDSSSTLSPGFTLFTDPGIFSVHLDVHFAKPGHDEPLISCSNYFLMLMINS